MTLLGKLAEALTMLEAANGVQNLHQDVERGNNHTRLEFDFSGDDQALSDLLADLVRAGIPLIQFSSDARDMEEVFLRATKGLVT
jgi:hypothetical protein